MAFDILSFAIGKAAGGGGDSETGLKYLCKYVSGVPATWGYRVSIDFGFTPGFIFVLPASVSLASGKPIYIALTEEFRSAIGESAVKNSYWTFSKTNTTLKYSGTSSDPTGDDTYAPIYGLDETGFNFGVFPSAGSYYIYAFGL